MAGKKSTLLLQTLYSIQYRFFQSISNKHGYLYRKKVSAYRQKSISKRGLTTL